MQKPAGEILLSASDLSFFAECAYRTWLDRRHLDHPMEKAADDDQSKLIQDKGYEHEERFFATLKAGVASCVEIDTDWSLEMKLEATRAAIQDGAEVIYQATLKRGNLMGHADFLVRSGRGSRGQWLYEVVDTKLARATKAKFLLQLCFYSDLLSDITGELPHHWQLRCRRNRWSKREGHRIPLLPYGHSSIGYYWRPRSLHRPDAGSSVVG